MQQWQLHAVDQKKVSLLLKMSQSWKSDLLGLVLFIIRCEGVCRAWRQEVHHLVATGKLQRHFPQITFTLMANGHVAIIVMIIFTILCFYEDGHHPHIITNTPFLAALMIWWFNVWILNHGMMDVPSDGAYVSADFPNKVERWVKIFAMRIFLLTKIRMVFMITMIFMIVMVLKTWIITKIMMLITIMLQHDNIHPMKWTIKSLWSIKMIFEDVDHEDHNDNHEDIFWWQ